LDYVSRDLSLHKNNEPIAFYSAEDADSLIEQGKPEHGEGAFYIWKASELNELLGSEKAKIFGEIYGVEQDGKKERKKEKKKKAINKQSRKERKKKTKQKGKDTNNKQNSIQSN